MADVFPPRVLPGRGEEWGRAVENRIQDGEKSEAQLEQKVDNGLRATGGQLAVLAGQIDLLQGQIFELMDGRVTRTVNVDPVPFSYTTSSGLPVLRLTIPLTMPGAFQEPRSATLAGSFQIEHVSGVGGNVYVEIVKDGVTVWRSGSLPVGLGASTPPGWSGGEASFIAAFPVTEILPDSVPLEVRVWTVDLSSGSNSRIFSGLTASITYTDPIQQ